MSIAAALREALEAGEPCILVRVERTQGSTPREAGAAMLVTERRLVGTVGGGALEMEAVIEARRMLREDARTSALDIPLGPAIGQCCGGRVRLSLARGGAGLLAEMLAAEEAERADRPSVLVFGAGHTGLALAEALVRLPLRVRVVDTRADRLAALPPGVETALTPLPEVEIEEAPPRSAFVVMTHDHALDFLLASAALRRRDSPYVGMIGSATKREKFRRHLELEGREAEIDRLVLPIGGNAVRDKRPEIIAALAAAELLQHVFAKSWDKPCPGFAQADAECNNEATDPSEAPAPHHAAAS